MPEIDVQDELVETFEPSALPPAARDGSLELPALRAAPLPYPRLCEQGPCRHYHQFQIQMDAGAPMPTKAADGSLEQTPGSFHQQTHHYCYPTAGVEMRLGSLPILQCNRWDPRTEPRASSDSQEYVSLELGRDHYRHSHEGQQHAAAIEAWRAQRKDLDDQIVAAELQAAEDLAAMPKPEDEAPYFAVVIHGRTERCERVDAKWDETVLRVARRGLTRIVERCTDHNANIVVPVEDYEIYDARGKKLNPDQTVAQAGLTKGDVISLDPTPKKGPTP